MAGFNFGKPEVAVCKASTPTSYIIISAGQSHRAIFSPYKQHDKSVSPMATLPSRISSAVLEISMILSIKSLLHFFENANSTFDHPSRKVSIHSEHLETHVP
jgi:hypothetical protein